MVVTSIQVATMHELNLTVAQTYCYLPTDPTLTPATLTAVKSAFATLRAAGVKALLRFAYDRNEPGITISHSFDIYFSCSDCVHLFL